MEMITINKETGPLYIDLTKQGWAVRNKDGKVLMWSLQKETAEYYMKEKLWGNEEVTLEPVGSFDSLP